jgi:hypothetical protein
MKKLISHLILVSLIVVLGSVVLFVVPTRSMAGNIEPGAKIFVAPMKNGLDQFIVAEIMKRKIPVSITQDERLSEYVIAGKSVDKGDNTKWFDVVFGTVGRRDSVQASVSLIKKSDKSIVWANNQGDRSIFWGGLKKSGERKVAIRLVKSFKKDLFK